ncbi:hypothetical protein [Candidatus Villigracilis proximus]|uniref:hypothetical protein n=1 Tax=Candidatus Villigracilis proximus TaxID=3140683 RepID=UPI0031EFAD04
MADDDSDGNGCISQDLSCQLAAGGYKPKTKEEIAKDLHLERPVSGVHVGASGQGGVLGEFGAYGQLDFIIDWKTGTLYKLFTFGLFEAGGTPNGLEGEFYGGTTNVHGIPLYGSEDISGPLAGKNIDAAVSAGGDAVIKISGTKG